MWSTIKDIIQSTAIIVTLLFTFWQFKKNRETVKVDNYSKLINALNNLRGVRIQNPDVERALFRSRRKWTDTKIKRRVYAVQLANIFEWSVLSYRRGLISDKEWKDWSSMWKRVILADKSMRELLGDETIYTFNLDAHKQIKAWISELKK
jgi:hypothetical protein